jgi:prepilin-type N-terminal cleavage/methylation domain-containing protein
MYNFKKAFTLIELLVIIFIIGIISAIIYVGLNRAQVEARDSVRKADVASYAKALMMEKTIGSEEFPKEEAICCLDAQEGDPLYCSNARTKEKMKEVLTAIPVDPLHDGTTNHCYRYISNGSSATITVPLEKGEIYTYMLGDRALTETLASDLTLTTIANPPQVGGNWTRTSGDKSIVRMGIGDAPLTREEGEEIVNSTTQSFNDEGLDYDIRYCYTLWNYNSFDNLYSKPSVSCTTTYPESITSLSAVPVSSSSINLSWVKPDSSYRTIIRRSTSSNPQSVTDGEGVYSNTTGDTYTDSGLSAGNTYYYSAFSHNESTNLNSAPISSSAITAPASPSIAIGATSSSSTSIVFSIPQNSDSVYIRYIKGSSAPSLRTEGVLIGSQSISPYAHGSLDSNSEYCYSVWSYNSLTSLYSDSPSTGCATTLITTPAVPSLSVAAASPTAIAITYNLPANASRTEIERISPVRSWSQNSDTSVTDSGLTANTEYCYKARSCNSQDSCSAYTTNQCVTTETGIVGAPTTLTCTSSGMTTADCSWGAVTNADTYELQRNSSTIQNTSATSRSDTGLSCNTTYNYQVRSCNTYGCSGSWKTATVTTIACVPAVPTTLTCSGSSTTAIDCSWSASTGANNYELQRNSSTIQNTSATSRSDTGLSCGTTYNYQVRACSAGGCSAWKTTTGTTVVCGGVGSLIAAVNNMKGTGNGVKAASTTYASLSVEYLEIAGDTTYSSNPAVGNATADSALLAIRYTGNLTINPGVTLTPQARKKGMLIYVDGTLNLNGAISMTARGAIASGDRIYVLTNGGTSYEIPAVGGGGGSSGTNGGTGGGGQGSGNGGGGAGTSYSGGAGGGGGCCDAGAGSSSGGAGGSAANWSGCNAGGAGNPGGYGQTAYGGTGTGGLLIIYANNVVISSSGSIHSNGSAGGTAPQVTDCRSGGGSGGGSINIFYNGSYSNSGSVVANGGSGGGNWNPGNPGGSGTVRAIKVGN